MGWVLRQGPLPHSVALYNPQKGQVMMTSYNSSHLGNVVSARPCEKPFPARLMLPVSSVQ